MNRSLLISGLFLLSGASIWAAMPEISQDVNAKRVDILKCAGQRPYVTKSFRNDLTRAQEVELITEVVGDTTVLSVRGTGYFDYQGMEYMISYQDKATIMVDPGDGYVYIQNPISQLMPTNTFLKGEKVGDDKIVFKFPQLLSEVEENGYLYQYYANRMAIGKNEDGTNWMFLDKTADTISFEFDGDEWIMESPGVETIIGFCDEYAQWTGYGDEDMVLSIFTEKANVAPADQEPEKWALTYNGDGRWVDVWIKDNDITVKGMFRSMPEAVMQGRINGNKIFFPSVQYVGICNGYHSYVMGVNKGTQIDLNGKEVSYDMLTEGVTFDYDAEKGILNAVEGDILVLNSGAEYAGVFEYIPNARINMQKTLTSYQPLKPTIVEVKPPMDGYPGSFIHVNIPMMNVANELIDPEKMTYRFFFDDVVYPVRGDGYVSDHETFLEIPYNYTDKFDIWVADIRHGVYFYDEDYNQIGAQSIYYHDENNVGYSEIAYHGNPSGVEVTDAQNPIVAEEFFTLDGLKVMNAENGIFISRRTHQDGTVTFRKVAKR